MNATETNSCSRTYYAARTVQSADGLMAFIYRPVKSITVVTSRGESMTIQFDEPKSRNQCSLQGF